MGAGDALFLALEPRDDAEDVFGQTMHGRGRISFGIFFFTTGKCTVSPSDRVSIIAPDHLRIVENLSLLVAVTRTRFTELSLAFVSIQRSVAFLIMVDPPKLETRIGYGKLDAVSVRHVLRFVESRMFVPIEHRPYGIPASESITLRRSRFLNRTFDNRSRIADAPDQDQPYGRPVSEETVECSEISGFRGDSFRNDHDP